MKLMVQWAKGFLNTENALKMPVMEDWKRVDRAFHPGCPGIVRECPWNPLVQGCDHCGRREVSRWCPEFRFRPRGQEGE